MITEEELNEWGIRYATNPDVIYSDNDFRVVIPRLIAEVRRQREVRKNAGTFADALDQAEAKIEKQREETERLEREKIEANERIAELEADRRSAYDDGFSDGLRNAS